jgi:hypothetical protein
MLYVGGLGVICAPVRAARVWDAATGEAVSEPMNRPVLLYLALVGQWRYFRVDRQANRNNADC